MRRSRAFPLLFFLTLGLFFFWAFQPRASAPPAVNRAPAAVGK